MADRCHILPPQRLEPAIGCDLPRGHLGPHHAISRTEGKINWSVDACCCCLGCQSDDPDDWCIIWSKR